MHVANEHGDPIDALCRLLQQWVDLAFPMTHDQQSTSPSLRRTDDEIRRLNAMWDKLAEALANDQRSWRTAFSQEMGHKRHTPLAGEPPTETLSARLRDLVSLGVNELFLAVAIRHSLDGLIAGTTPEAEERWLELADTALPIALQFGYWHGQVPPSNSPLRPSS